MPPTASMFRDFSFAPAARPDHEAERDDTNVSPTSRTTATFYPLDRPVMSLSYTVGDLAAQFNQQSLRVDPAFASEEPSPPRDCASHLEDNVHAQPPYSRVAASLLRLQRQSHSRIQCQPSHVRNLAAMVRMMEDEEQCTVTDSDMSRTSSQSSMNSTLSEHETKDTELPSALRHFASLAEAQAWRTEKDEHCARVTRPIRMRKRSAHGIVKKRSL